MADCMRTLSDCSGVGCCISEDDFKKRQLSEVVQNKERNCTDVPCLLAMIVVFGLQIYLISYAADNGADPDSLLHGYDYQGKWCNENHADGELNAWVNPQESFTLRICVESCKQTYLDDDANMTVYEVDDRIVHPYDSEAFLDAYCIPKDFDDFDAFERFGDYGEAMQRGISDIDTAKWMILICAFLTMFFGFIYLRVIEWIGGIIIWTTIIAFFIGGIIGAWLLISDGIDNYNSDSSSDTARWELAVGILIIIILLCLFCAMFWLKKRIDLALVMLDQAGDCIIDMKGLLVFPIAYSFPVMLYMAFWIWVALYIYSAKESHTQDVPDWFSDSSLSSQVTTYKYYDWDEGLQNALVFHFIALLYFMQVFIYFGFMVLAGAIADWYFSEWEAGASQKRKVRGTRTAELSEHPILESLGRVMRFHLGSLAFGALIITFIRILRATLYYIQKKTEAAENPLTKCLFGCAQCCLSCCQCILDKCSKDGFIFCSIYGTNFCYSSYQAIKLIWSNIGRTAMVEGISKYMEIIGRFGIAMLTTGIAIVVFREYEYYDEHLSSFIYPAIPVFIISYLIASLFMMVFEVAVDTLFLCFLVDEIVNSPPKFAADALVELARQHGNVLSEAGGTRGNEQQNIVRTSDADTTTQV